MNIRTFLPADYWSISIVDCVSLCLMPGCFWIILYPALFSLVPINFVVVSGLWQTEVVSSRLRHSCHRLLVPSSRSLGGDQRQLLRNSDVRKPHFEDLGAALSHYFRVRHPTPLLPQTNEA